MNKNIKIFVILTVLICCFGMLTACSKDNEDIPPKDNVKFFEMNGTLTHYTDSTVTVQIPNGDKFTFSTEGVDVHNENEKMYLGSPIVVGYYGALNDFAEVQKVDVSIIAIGISPSVTYAQQKLEKMTLEEKVGQMFFARCPEDKAALDAKTYNIGGYILFARDFSDKTKTQVIDNIKSYQNSSKFGMFIGVDEEGGSVVRVSKYTEFRSSPFLSPSELYKNGGFDLIKSDTKEKCELLLSLGINVNLAPVCDVPSSNEDFIYNRAFSTDAALTAQYSKIVTDIMNENKIAGCLKHFPGYGNNSDTHTGIAYDQRSFDTFEKMTFYPLKVQLRQEQSLLWYHTILLIVWMLNILLRFLKMSMISCVSS